MEACSHTPGQADQAVGQAGGQAEQLPLLHGGHAVEQVQGVAWGREGGWRSNQHGGRQGVRITHMPAQQHAPARTKLPSAQPTAAEEASLASPTATTMLRDAEVDFSAVDGSAAGASGCDRVVIPRCACFSPDLADDTGRIESPRTMCAPRARLFSIMTGRSV